ncbi:hypothetical protein MMC27_000125 [Xylographa pallens]|nr:hypothetical protein [Xylographa pallens]
MHSITHSLREARNLLSTTEQLFQLIVRTFVAWLPIDPLARVSNWIKSSASMIRDARALLGYPPNLTHGIAEWDIKKLGKRQLIRCAFVKPSSFGLIVKTMEAHSLHLETLLDAMMVLVEQGEEITPTWFG